MAGRDDWKAEAWYLRFVRGYPDRHEHTGSPKLALDGAKLMTLSDEEPLERVRRDVEDRREAPEKDRRAALPAHYGRRAP